MYDDRFEGLALVAFLDLLGFSQRVNETWGSDKSILPVILGLKECVNQPPRVRVVLGDDKAYFHSDAFSISDSIVLRYPLQHGGAGKEVYGAFLAMTAQIHDAVGYAADHGFAIRGGVELGPIYWDGHEMIGPAFNAAYHLEAKVAGSARVVVGPALLRKFAEFPDIATIQAATVIHEAGDGLPALNPNMKVVPKMRELQAAAPASVAGKYAACINKVRSIEQTFGPKHGRWNRLADAVEAALAPAPPPAPRGDDFVAAPEPARVLSKRARRRRKGRRQ